MIAGDGVRGDACSCTIPAIHVSCTVIPAYQIAYVGDKCGWQGDADIKTRADITGQPPPIVRHLNSLAAHQVRRGLLFHGKAAQPAGCVDRHGDCPAAGERKTVRPAQLSTSTSTPGELLAHFVSAFIAHALGVVIPIIRPRRAALIAGDSSAICKQVVGAAAGIRARVGGVDGIAAGKQGMGIGWPPVILQGSVKISDRATAIGNIARAIRGQVTTILNTADTFGYASGVVIKNIVSS